MFRALRRGREASRPAQGSIRMAGQFVFASVLLLPVAAPASAQVLRATDNSSWEENDPPGANPTFRIYTNAEVPGWDSTTGNIEIWDTGFLSVNSADGIRHAELNANTNGATYQEFCLINGDQIDWSFYHRKRSGGASVQNVSLQIATTGGTVLQTLATNATTNTSSWDFLQGVSAPFTGATGTYRIQFSTTNSGSVGNFLDDMDIKTTPHVEFALNNTSSVEGEVSPTIPTVAVSGRFDVATDITVQVTGGTATLGSDFDTPSGTASWTISIPPGTYDADEFPIGITISDEGSFDSGETIEFELVALPTVYDLSSTQTCGAAPKQTATHTITEAADLITVKTLGSGNATPIAGDVVSFDILVTNNGPSTATAVSLTDLLPAGLSPTVGNGAVSQGSYSAGSGVWTVGDLANGASATLTIEGTVDGGTGGLTITNTTSAASGDQPDLSTTGDMLSASVTVTPSFDLEVRKTNTPGVNGDADQAGDGVITGSTTTYTITVINNGPDEATGVVVSDTPGTGITCSASIPVSITGDGVPTGSFTFADLSGAGITLGTLADGDSAALTFSCDVD